MLKTIPKPPRRLHGPRPSQKTIDACRLVLEGGWSVRAAAKHIGVSYPAVRARVEAIRKGSVMHEAEDSENWRKGWKAA